MAISAANYITRPARKKAEEKILDTHTEPYTEARGKIVFRYWIRVVDVVAPVVRSAFRMGRAHATRQGEEEEEEEEEKDEEGCVVCSHGAARRRRKMGKLLMDVAAGDARF